MPGELRHAGVLIKALLVFDPKVDGGEGRAAEDDGGAYPKSPKSPRYKQSKVRGCPLPDRLHWQC